MINHQSGAGFEFESRQQTGVLIVLFGQHLDRNFLFRFEICRAIDPTHAAGTKDVVDAKVLDEEAAMLTFQQSAGLQSSEDATADERLSCWNSPVVAAHVKLLNGSVDFLGSEETALSEAFNEL